MKGDVVGRVAPWVQMHWDWRAAGNFIGGGTGTGLLIMVAATGAEPAGGAILVGLLCIAAGLSCVWAEIGRPWRALNVFRHARTSWMTREALVAPAVFVGGALALLTQAPAWRVVTAVCAAAFLYCQARMLQAAKGIPAWRQPRLVPLILLTGLAEGAGLLAVWRLATPAATLPAWFGALLALLCVGRSVCWMRYRTGVRRDGAPRAALQVLDGFNQRFMSADLLAAAGAAAGLFGGAWLTGCAGGVALLAGWALKATILRRAAFNQGFALVVAPERGVGGPGPPARPGWN
jgi:phenylacetyl-CoA:acceptor oxidoreductase subunit 2